MKTLPMCAVVLAFTALSSPAFAETADHHFVNGLSIEEIGAAERVRAAALLRVLSQKTASVACHMAHDISPKDARSEMIAATDSFNASLDALQYGNLAMNIIGAELNRKTVAQIEDVRAEWTPVYEATKALLDDPHDPDALRLISEQSDGILSSASDLTSRISGEYSNPAELMLAHLMLLDFSARQTMLTQRMAKTACEIWAGNRSEEHLELLGQSVEMYNMTLLALLDGMPNAGILAAPTPQIESALKKATEDWRQIKSGLDMVLAGEEVHDDLKSSLYRDLNIAMQDMEKIEKLYSAFSKQGTIRHTQG